MNCSWLLVYFLPRSISTGISLYFVCWTKLFSFNLKFIFKETLLYLVERSQIFSLHAIHYINLFFTILHRFADFVEGNSWHVTDDELLEYDSGPDVLLRGDDDDSDQEIPVQRPNNPPDSTEGGEIIDSTDEEDPAPEETSDQSIDGPPLSW